MRMKSRVKKCRPVRYGSGGKRQQQRRGWGDGNDDGGRKRQRQRGSELMASADSGTTTLTRQNVVVTGSTRGLGRALVLEFLKAGDRVCVSSRNEDDVRKSVQSLEKDYGDAVSGKKCDVSIAKDVEKLATCAAERGNIDIWIANAASNAVRPARSNTTHTYTIWTHRRKRITRSLVPYPCKLFPRACA